MSNEISEALEAIERDGFTVVPDVINHAQADALLEELSTLERELGTEKGPNKFEGFDTVRVYNLLAHGALWEQIPVHERVLPIVEGVLDPGCLVSSLSSIRIGPGESAQMIHADDQLIPLAKPHEAVVCNTIWALTDFTDENGATRLIPGSHRRDHSPDVAKQYESIPAEMPRGSVLVWHGSLWHGGGGNQTDRDRVGIAMNYCAGYIRQQENQQLGIPRDVARHFSPRLQALVGYGIYRSLIGHIEKTNPAGLLGGEPDMKTAWDR